MKHLKGYRKAMLALEDGTIFSGRSFTGECETEGEVVFNTSMSGYQEILTDPSYCGQMVTMTYPLIGNYGVNEEDIESGRVQVRALLVKEYQEFHSNWRSKKSLAEYLREYEIPGIEGIDTRALTRHIRLSGAMRGALSTRDLDPPSLVEKARNCPEMNGCDLVKEVTCREPMLWVEGMPVPLKGGLDEFQWPDRSGWRVVAMDYGVKYNILRSLEKRGCTVLMLPGDS
ncbi:MAG: carbamoyl phosphate synthase small subunit, partial [Deltaproteobacteria bacterium]